MPFIHKAKHRILSLPLFSKLVIINIFLVLLPILIIIPLTTQKLTELNHEEFSKYSLETVQQISNSISITFNELEQLSNVIITDKNLQADFSYPKHGYEIEKIKKFSLIGYQLYMLFEHKEEYTSYLLYGYNGEIFSNGFTMIMEEFDFDNYVTSLDSITYQGPHTRPYARDDTLVFSIQIPIKSFSTFEQLGYMIVDLNYTYFHTLIDDVNYSNTIDIMIVDQEQILYSSDQNRVLTPLDPKLHTTIFSQSYGSEHGVLDKEDVYYSFYPIGDTGWKVVAFHSLASYDSKSSALFHFMLVITAISLICSCFLLIMVSRSISRPLKKLSLYMENVQNGDFSVQFHPKYNDEIGKLCHSFNYMLTYTNTLINDVYKLELAEKNATIYALQSQINPHFLYNTLQMLSDFAEAGDSSEVTTISGHLSSIFRYCLDGENRFVLLDHEINHIENYVYIQSIRLNHRFKFILDIPDECFNIHVPRLILQPLVENAIDHGIYPKLNNGEISISCQQTDQMLKIEIRDNGIGMTKEKLTDLQKKLKNSVQDGPFKANSIGIENVHRRLILSYGADFGLHLDSQLNVGTTISLLIPCSEG